MSDRAAEKSGTLRWVLLDIFQKWIYYTSFDAKSVKETVDSAEDLSMPLAIQ